MPQTLDPPKSSKPPPASFHAYPFWSPRFWHGMRLGDWLRLAARGRFRIHPLRVPMAVMITACGLFNSAMYGLQQLRYGRRIVETPIAEPPIFIVGHWRSGTTHLHELLVRDDRLGFPTTYECFAPNHFLVTGWLMPRLLWFLLPSKRPMDNMAAGFDRPQEDEFALCVMGAATPYARMAFPNDPAPHLETLDMQGLSETDLHRWKQSLYWFVQALTLHKGKRLVMKSPPHTGRVQLLAEMFPGARFIHIVRDPYAIFPSTRRLWQSLDEAQGLQLPRHEHLDELVFEGFERMYAGFERQRPHLDPGQICDVRYEDLVRDPLGQLQAVYEKLELGDFQPVRDKLQAYVGSQKDYQTNRHELDPAVKAEIRRRWSGYFEKYGFE